MNKPFYYRLLVAIGWSFVFFCQAIEADAQISEGGIPPSFQYETTLRSHLATTEVPVTFHVADLKLVDEWQLAEGIAPPKVAISIDVALNVSNAGQWSSLPGGEMIWQLHLCARGAMALMIYYADFYIPEGGELYIYNPGKTQILGAYTHRTHPSGGAFATELVGGDELVLEYVAAPNGEMPRIDIESVGYAYNHVFIENGGVSLRRTSAPCEVNVNCEEGDAWQNQKKGVCYMTQKIGSDTYLCSGSLVNNTASDLKPYILSAAHCASAGTKEATAQDMQQWMFYFHREYESCSNASGIVASKTIAGCKKMAMTKTDGESDGLLLLLNTPVPANYNVYYNGWDRRSTPAQSGVGIHHPLGDLKKISTFRKPVTSYTFNSEKEGITGEKNAHWNAVFVATANGHGITESGSSGSPLFNENKLIVGTLTGGNSSCTELSGLNLYGKMGYHWNRYTKADSTRMDKWLDPLNSGAETLEGRYHSLGETNPPLDPEGKYRPDQTILLTWKKPGSGSPVKYNVYCNHVKIAETTKLSYIDASPQTGTQYYGVSCVYANGSESNTANTVVLVSEFKPPVNVEAAYTMQQEVAVTWEAPVYEQTIYWGESQAMYQVMLSGAKSYYFGQQWSTDDIRSLHKKTVKAVKFIPIRGNTYEVYIAQGGDRAYTQKITNPVYSNTNTVELTTPFVIDGMKDLIVAIYVSEHSQTGKENEYPAVCDAGPAVQGKGNIYSYDAVEWNVLYDGVVDPDGFNYNFFVSAVVSSEEGEIPASNRMAQKGITRSGSEKVGVRIRGVSFPSEPVTLYSLRPAAFPDVTEYVVYRNSTKIASAPASSGRYVDDEPYLASYYQVAAIYEGGYEGALSDSASIDPLSNGLIEEGSIMLYPAVFSDQIEIKGLYQVKHIDVYDSRGKLCLRVIKPDNILDTRSLSPGVYFFHLSMEKGQDHVLRGIKNKR